MAETLQQNVTCFSYNLGNYQLIPKKLIDAAQHIFEWFFGRSLVSIQESHKKINLCPSTIFISSLNGSFDSEPGTGLDASIYGHT